jgi:hypothetical protein
MLALSRALMCCGAFAEAAMVDGGAGEAASTGTPPFKESVYWGIASVRTIAREGLALPDRLSLSRTSRLGCSARRPSYVFGVPGVNPTPLI